MLACKTERQSNVLTAVLPASRKVVQCFSLLQDIAFATMDPEILAAIQGLLGSSNTNWKPACDVLYRAYHAGQPTMNLDTLVTLRPSLAFGKRLCQIGTHAKDPATRRAAMRVVGGMAVHRGETEVFKTIAAHPTWVKPMTEAFLAPLKAGVPVPPPDRDAVADTFFMLSGFGLSLPPEDFQWMLEYYPLAAEAIKQNYDSNMTIEAIHFVGKSSKDPAVARMAIEQGLFPSILAVR
jgi:hypothetical protein